MQHASSHYYENVRHKGERWTLNHAIGMADLKLFHYASRTMAFEWQTDRFIRIASCEEVRCNKFWNKKIHGWFRSHFQVFNRRLKQVSRVFNNTGLPLIKNQNLGRLRKIWLIFRKQLFVFARLKSDHMFACYLSPGTICLFLTSCSRHGKLFLICLFLESSKC